MSIYVATALHRSHILLKDSSCMLLTYVTVMLAGNNLLFMSEVFPGIMHRTTTLDNVRGGGLAE
nr:MAG TPA: hypothetical protein [Bacteriophage sp.]